jgi:hypothetical protein
MSFLCGNLKFTNMKKMLAVATLILATISMNAQDKNFKPVPGSITAEVGLTGGLNNANFSLNGGANNTTGRSGGVLRFRYFNSADLGFRIGLAVRNTKNENNSLTGGPNNEMITATSKNSGIEFNIGAEKHFAGTNRLSTYVGGDILFITNAASYEEINTNGNFNKFKSVDPTTNSRAGSSFGVRLVTGADFYIARKLYLGTEVGLSILSGKTKRASQSTKSGSLISETNIAEPGKTFNITPAVITGLRIGYQF